MQAIIPSLGLKAFSKALACLSKYGEDLVIQALPDELVLSATNSAKSAYGEVTLQKFFFEKYTLGNKSSQSSFDEDVVEVEAVTGQLLVKPLLSILRHRTVEKTVERCEISIVEGADNDEAGEDQDAFSSKLILRLYCKHGVTKTHRLLLSEPSSISAPNLPTPPILSKVKAGSRTIKDLLDAFSQAKSTKGDILLSWEFGTVDVTIKSSESAIGSGKKEQGHIQTSNQIEADEFEIYDLNSAPIVLSFHLREFNAAIQLAEALSLPLTLKFTKSEEPLSITIESEYQTYRCILATSLIGDASSGESSKRKRGDSEEGINRRKSARVVEEVRSDKGKGRQMVAPPPPFIVPSQPQSQPQAASQHRPTQNAQPLFLSLSQGPSNSQREDEEMPRGTQLGNEFITEDEVDDLFGGDLDFDDDGAGGGSGGGEREGEKAEDDVEMEIGATQMPNGTNNFRLLFDDV